MPGVPAKKKLAAMPGVKFTKEVLQRAKIRDKNPSLNVIQPKYGGKDLVRVDGPVDPKVVEMHRNLALKRAYDLNKHSGKWHLLCHYFAQSPSSRYRLLGD